MPSGRWFLYDLQQEDVDGGFIITLTTNTPCHLWLYWSDKEPWVHRKGVTERGLTMPWASYWCFVAWQKIEQTEPGDTTTHTFTWLGWVTCQTRYLRFHGTIDGLDSPSDSPIFIKHYSYVPPPPIHHYSFTQIADDTGYLQGRSSNYLAAHNASSARYVSLGTTTSVNVGQSKIDRNFRIFRGVVTFDATSIPLAEQIISASLRWYQAPFYHSIPFDLRAVRGEFSTPPIASDYGRLLYEKEPRASINTGDIVENADNSIPLNAQGLAEISKEALTKFAWRSSRDINSTKPPEETDNRLTFGRLQNYLDVTTQG